MGVWDSPPSEQELKPQRKSGTWDSPPTPEEMGHGPAPKADPDDVGPVHAALLGTAQGATLDFGDEIGAEAVGALGGDKKADLQRTRTADAANKAEYPKIYGTGKAVGAFLSPINKIVPGGGAKAGLVQRMLTSMGLGAAFGAADAAGQSEYGLTDDRTIDAAKKGGIVGGVVGGAAQGLIGEPARYLSNKITGAARSNEEGIARTANEAIASAGGKLGKQHQEAAGAAANLEQMAFLDRFARENPTAGVGATRAARPANIGASRALEDLDQSAIDAAKGYRVNNAQRAIREAHDNPIQVPRSDQAVAAAEAGAEESAKALAGKGAMQVGVGALGAKVGGPVGMLVGGGGAIAGFRNLAKAAATSPSVMRKLSALPKYGMGLAKYAGKGGAALEVALSSVARHDPEAASQIQQIQQEISQQDRGLEE